MVKETGEEEEREKEAKVGEETGKEEEKVEVEEEEIPYSRKIWRELYLAIWPPTAEINILAEFKFGDLRLRSKISLRNSCVRIRLKLIWQKLNLAVPLPIAKPPN